MAEALETTLHVIVSEGIEELAERNASWFGDAAEVVGLRHQVEFDRALPLEVWLEWLPESGG